MELLAWVIAGGAALTAVYLARRLRGAVRRAEELERELDVDKAADRALAAAEERARIAREMHDVVAHTLSVMVAQADGGLFAGANDPKQAQRALETIADVGRSALTEMRSLLGVLRESNSDTAMGPQPGLADVPTLVAGMREGGLAVSFVTTGTPHPLPIGAGLAVYRIVQEALTNVLKHAGPSVTTFVQLQWEDDAVTVTISDDGRGAAARSDGKGSGLEGMRERTTVFSGTLDAGPKAGGGYLVRARLPLGTGIGGLRTALPSVAPGRQPSRQPDQDPPPSSLPENLNPIEETP
ncbi:sensor histidine kinase [Demequina aurantiaca]|uniref:sensor histidine kinase n=1 Tax=Demequina aurantiaca TaxID=676200 RepID=UPI003D352FC6